MIKCKRDALPQWDVFMLRQRINRTGGYRVRALRRLHSSLKLHTMSNILHLPVAHELANQVSDDGKARTSLPIVTTEQFAAWEEVSNYGGW